MAQTMAEVLLGDDQRRINEALIMLEHDAISEAQALEMEIKLATAIHRH